MRAQKPREVAVQRLDERRYALSIGGIVRYDAAPKAMVLQSAAPRHLERRPRS